MNYSEFIYSEGILCSLHLPLCRCLVAQKRFVQSNRNISDDKKNSHAFSAEFTEPLISHKKLVKYGNSSFVVV